MNMLESESVVVRRECISVFRVAFLETSLQPSHALCGCAVVERIRNRIAPGLFLEIVVADAGGYCNAFLDIAGLKGVEHLIVVMRPDAGIEIRLEFEPDADLVGFGLRGGLAHRRVCLPQSAEKVLDMVSYFVAMTYA